MHIVLKNIWIKIKWMARHAQPFIASLSLTILLAAASSLSGIIMALLTKRLIDSAATGQIHQMLRYILVTSAVILTDVGLKAAVSIMASRNLTALTCSIQQELYARLAKTQWSHYSKYHSGDFIIRMTSDVDAVASMLVTTLPNILSMGVMLFASFTVLMFFEPLLAFAALLLGPLSIILTRFYSRRLKRLYIKMQETETAYRSFIQESILNMSIIKAFCLEKGSVDRVKSLQSEKLKLVQKRSLVSAGSGSILTLSSWLGYFMAFCWGAFNLSKDIATFGTFTALLQLVGSIQSPFSALAHALPQIISASASAERLMELDNLPLEEDSNPVDLPHSSSIQLDNICFGYDGKSFILKNVSAVICPGETAAITGPSGVGKTTLIRLLLSFVQPKTGHVHFINDGKKVEASASMRSLIAYVPQGNTLFSGTIADNLRFGNPAASDRELEAAVHAAGAWEFIKNLSQGLYTTIGEQGLGLSEGQAQRLAIARALLRKTPILILDEATSALDIATEVKVLQSIRSLQPARTCIIVTHRSTALSICHRVFRLEDGLLVELPASIAKAPAIEAI